MKDALRRCTEVYGTLIHHTYRLTLEDGTILHIRFEEAHFKHLLGLHKLSDIHDLREMNANRVYKQICREEQLFSAICKSEQLYQIQNRIHHFGLIPLLMHSKIIIDFDPRLIQSETKLKNTDYILYRSADRGYVNLAIGEHLSGFYPQTFFYEPSKKYIDGQKLLDIVATDIIAR